jgi:hypothetical protein
MNITPNDPRDPEFLRQAEAVRQKFARQLLEDNDLLLLACEEISRTFTREEMRYSG